MSYSRRLSVLCLLAPLLSATADTASAACVYSAPTLTCSGGNGSGTSLSHTDVNISSNVTAVNYPLAMTVNNAPTGATITGLQVQFLGFNADGGVANGGACPNCTTLNGTGILLIAPSGRYLELLHSVGSNGATDTIINSTLNILDTGVAAPNQTSAINGNGSTFSWKPSSYPDQNTTADPGGSGLYPSSSNLNGVQQSPNGNPILARTPQSIGSATLTSASGVFTGDAPNGVWGLYMVDDQDGLISFSSWNLIFTISVSSTSTTTTLTSGTDPSFTASPNNTTQLTATITGGTGITGTVAFKEGANNLTCSEGAQPIAVSSGVAHCTTSFTTEGSHSLTANYSGAGSFLASSGTATQYVKRHSTIVSGAYCNQGAISTSAVGTTTPYPSVVNVGTDTTALTNSVATVSVTLNGLTTPDIGGLSSVAMLLASPGNSRGLKFLSFAGGNASITTPINLTLTDSASNGLVPFNFSSAPTGNVSYLPTSYVHNNSTFPAPSAPAPQPPSSYGIAATEGNPTAKTFTTEFDGASGNGDWTLFISNFNGQNVSIASGWCMNITQSTGTATTTTVTGSPNRSATGTTVTVTATVVNTNTSAPITAGSVSFTSNGVNVPGGPTSALPLDLNGHASFTTSSLPEGDNPIMATYNGTGGFSLSFGNYTQRVDDATSGPTINGNIFTYCNTGVVTLPDPNNSTFSGQASPNPSNIFVSSFPGTINKVQLDLKSLHMQGTDHLTGSLLVGPAQTTASTFDFFTNAGSGAGTISGNYSFLDTAASSLSTASDPAAGSYKPGSFGSALSYFGSSSGFFTLPAGPYNRAAVAGTSTFATLYANGDANGTWSLYFNQNINQPGNGLTNGWCLDITNNPPVLGITKSHTGPGAGNAFIAGQTGTYTLTVKNNGPGSTNGQTVTVTDTLPANFTQSQVATSAQWNCGSSTSTVVTCTSSTAIASGNNFDAIVVTVTPSASSGSSASNQATVSGSGMTGATSTADVATIIHAPNLSLSITDNGSPAHTFKQGDSGKTATITLSDDAASGPTTSAVTLTFTINSATAIVPQSITPPGAGWTCQPVAASFTCSSTGSPALAAGGSAQFTLNFNVSLTAGSSQTIMAAVSGGGGNTPSNTDTLTINSVPVLAIAKSHTGTFTQGSTAAWTIQVTNNATSAGGTTSGTTTVLDTLPAGYTLASFSGSTWACTGTGTANVSCTSTAGIAGAGGTFAPLIITVNVPANSPTSVSNTASAFGGGDPVHAASGSAITSPADNVTVVQVAATVAVSSGSGQSKTINTAFTNPLVALVTDSGGNPVSGVVVTFTAPAQTGASATFAGGTNTATTNASGLATSVVVSANGHAGGPYNVVASAPGAGTSANFSLTNTAGSAATIAVSSGSGQTATVATGFGSPLVALVTDSGGNPVSGVVVTFTAPVQTGPSATFAGGTITATTNSSGLATSVAITANSHAGTYNVSASAAGVAIPVNFSLTNTAAAGANLAVSSGSGQTAPINTAFASPLVALVTDTFGNPVSGVTVTFTPPVQTGASATFAGGANTATTNASGLATSVVVSANSHAGAYNVVASAVSKTANFSLTNTAGPAATVAVSSGGGQSTMVSTAFANPLVALVTDSGGNPVSGVVVTFTAPVQTGPSATFAGGTNTATTNAAGQATSVVVSANSHAGGPYNVVATAPGAGTSANFSLTNTAGSAGSVTVSSGSGQSATVATGFGLPLVALVTDSGGNPVSGVLVTFTAPAQTGASATFAGGTNTATTNAMGLATSVVVSANTHAGTYTVSASAPGAATAANFSLTNTAAAAANIAVSSGSVQSTTIGTQFTNPLVALVTDTFGNPVSGVLVTFTAPAQSGASALFAGGNNTATTNASGLATSAAVSANSHAGAYSVSASAVSMTASFMLSNTAGSPATVAVFSGSGQSTMIGTAFTNPLVALVTDAGGNPLSGVIVTFTAPAQTGASATFAGGINTAMTNAAGLATSAAVSANSNAGGPYNVVASAPGAGTSANFALTNTAPAAGPTVVSFNVLFGTQSYNLTGTSRNRLPWQVTGIQVVFSAPIASADINSLSGVTPTSFSGLGTNTLTWSITPITLANVAAVLAGSGPDAILDAASNGLNGGAGVTQNFRVLWGDFNDDGVVSASDSVGVNAARSQLYNVFADINGDGAVNVTDVQLVRSLLGSSLP